MILNDAITDYLNYTRHERGLSKTTCEHSNVADLPTSKSLVRASAEPTQAQETVLLRVATQTSETPAEQLVRPAGGQG